MRAELGLLYERRPERLEDFPHSLVKLRFPGVALDDASQSGSSFPSTMPLMNVHRISSIRLSGSAVSRSDIGKQIEVFVVLVLPTLALTHAFF